MEKGTWWSRGGGGEGGGPINTLLQLQLAKLAQDHHFTPGFVGVAVGNDCCHYQIISFTYIAWI